MPTNSDNGTAESEEKKEEGWTWKHGWRGLVPTKHTFTDAELRLGKSTSRSDLANGVTYDFLDGSVRVTFLEGNETIDKIWVEGKPDLVHSNIDEAIESLGELKVTRVDRTEGVIYERDGMRICADPATKPERIMWIEIFKP